MQPLSKGLRNQLERTVMTAREVAEEAARVALEELGVGEARPYEHLSSEEKGLRQRLRAYGRNLGDKRDPERTTQSIDRLVEDVAYQHWHRMLFARFLAENDLLMYPDPENPVPVSLEECAELAPDFGAENAWDLAGRFAAEMLPQVFRADSPVFELKLPLEYQIELEGLVAGLAREVFTASDSLGWVYQFWQTKRKDEVNASEVKIGAAELPAVTQLFTEPYMVEFLLDNALGAWWAARRLTEDDLKGAASEEELRQKAAIAGVPLKYLRFVRDQESSVWRLASGTFEHWPQRLSELKVMDPCCGSGHFLVAALLMLTPMRMQLEGLSAREAVDAVLRENLHGLELDKRCVELAAFAVAFTAWRYPGAGGYRKLPNLNIACSGLAVNATKEEWLGLAAGHPEAQNALDQLYTLFQNAPVLGSLIDPQRVRQDLFTTDYQVVAELLEKALSNGHSDEVHEAGVVAHGLARAASLLAGKYHWVITNVPYLTRGKQGEVLRSFCDANYPDGKNDLANVFLERCLQFLVPGGTTSIVMPQNWLFLTSYKRFREKLLENDTWHMIARLGPQAFQTPMWDFNVQLLTMTKGIAPEGHTLCGLDVSEPRSPEEKAALLLEAQVKEVEQAAQLENPDARVTLLDVTSDRFLFEYANSLQGVSTGDAPRFIMCFWEIGSLGETWSLFQSSTESTLHFGGLHDVLRWEGGNGELARFEGAVIRGRNSWGRWGVGVRQMGNLPVVINAGQAWDTNCALVLPHNPKHLLAIWCFCSSPEYNEAVRQIDQKLNVTNASLVKVPFDLEYWTKVAEEKYPNGLPKPYSDDPTQWIFHGHPAQSEAPLQVAVARMLGYRWPAELDPEMELSEEARAWVKRSEALLAYADTDGIVPIPPLRGEPSAADRLLDLLAAAYGDDWSQDRLAKLLADADHAGKTLESWLRDKFFAQHCQLFQNRPFIWHIWDGLNDGFAALVNYHKLDRKTLEALIYTYLGEWIDRQRDAVAHGVDGAEEKLVAAEGLKERLELILEGEKPYDIFVRWKPLQQQPIGWEPDLNDGVRLNIRPFMTVPDVRLKGAGVLRTKPNIHWRKDRGKDVPSAPWYHVFKGDRINDYHLTLQEKRDSRRHGSSEESL